jgi:zinc protease
MNIRTSEPDIVSINTLNFIPEEPTILGCGVPVYCGTKRDVGVIKLELFWPYGSAIQNNPGFAKAAAHLLFAGTNTHTAEDILNSFEQWGATFSTNTNLLSTSVVVKTMTEHVDKVLPVLVEILEHAIYPEKEIFHYKQTETASLLRRMQTPGYWSNRMALEGLYGAKTPDAFFSSPDDIELLNSVGLYNFSHIYLSGKNATLFISGDYNDDILKSINKRFSTLNKPTKAEKHKFIATINKAPSSHTKLMEHSNQASVCFVKHIKRVDYITYSKLSLLNMFLGGFFGSRLMQELREEKGLTYGIGSQISMSTTGYTWSISGEMNSGNTAETLNACAEILTGLSQNPPLGMELEKAKQYYCGQLRSSFDGPFSHASKIQFLLKSGYPQDYYSTLMHTVWNTSTYELAELAHNYLQADSFTIALAGKIKTNTE